MKNVLWAVTVWRMWGSCVWLPAGVMARLFRTLFCLWAGWELLTPNSALGQQVYALEFNQGNNLFGTINLVNGSFTQLGNEGSTLFNDIAASPNGVLFGIINSTSLVTLNPNNGAVITSVSLNVSGIESLAIASDGAVYGATQSALYTINPQSGMASLIGSFNNSAIGSSGQNIRFSLDGNLYDTDGGVSATNTDLFQISTVNGQATLMGVVSNFPGLCLENAGSQMYGVGIQLGSASSVAQDLVGIDLSSLKPGGTNNDGSPLDVDYDVLTANFPNNYNFSSPDTFIIQAPEPGTVASLILGGTTLLFINYFRSRR